MYVMTIKDLRSDTGVPTFWISISLTKKNFNFSYIHLIIDQLINPKREWFYIISNLGFGQGILKGDVSMYCWPPVWLVWSQLYDNTDNFCFYLQNRLIQTSQTGGQWYSDTSPFKWCLHRRENITCLLLSPAMAIWKDKRVSIEIASLSEIAIPTSHVWTSLLLFPALNIW